MSSTNPQPPGALVRRDGSEYDPEAQERLLSATESLLLAGRSQQDIRKSLSQMESRRILGEDYGIDVNIRSVKRYAQKVRGRWKVSDEKTEGDVRARLIAAAEEVERQAIEDAAAARARGDSPAAAAFGNLRLRAIAQQSKLRGVPSPRPLLAPEDPINGPLPPREEEARDKQPVWAPDRNLARDVADILQRTGRLPDEANPDDVADVLLAPSGGDPAPPALPARVSGDGPMGPDSPAGGVPRTP